MQFNLSHWLKKGKLVSKQLVYYITNTKSLFHRSVYLFKENLSQNSPFTSKSNYHNFLKTSFQVDGWGGRGEI